MKKIDENVAMAFKNMESYSNGNINVVIVDDPQPYSLIYYKECAIAKYNPCIKTIYMTAIGNSTSAVRNKMNAVLEVFKFPYAIMLIDSELFVVKSRTQSDKELVKCKIKYDRWYRFHLDTMLFGGVADMQAIE